MLWAGTPEFRTPGSHTCGGKRRPLHSGLPPEPAGTAEGDPAARPCWRATYRAKVLDYLRHSRLPTSDVATRDTTPAWVRRNCPGPGSPFCPGDVRAGLCAIWLFFSPRLVTRGDGEDPWAFLGGSWGTYFAGGCLCCVFFFTWGYPPGPTSVCLYANSFCSAKNKAQKHLDLCSSLPLLVAAILSSRNRTSSRRLLFPFSLECLLPRREYFWCTQDGQFWS